MLLLCLTHLSTLTPFPIYTQMSPVSNTPHLSQVIRPQHGICWTELSPCFHSWVCVPRTQFNSASDCRYKPCSGLRWKRHLISRAIPGPGWSQAFLQGWGCWWDKWQHGLPHLEWAPPSATRTRKRRAGTHNAEVTVPSLSRTRLGQADTKSRALSSSGPASPKGLPGFIQSTQLQEAFLD